MWALDGRLGRSSHRTDALARHCRRRGHQNARQTASGRRGLPCPCVAGHNTDLAVPARDPPFCLPPRLFVWCVYGAHVPSLFL